MLLGAGEHLRHCRGRSGIRFTKRAARGKAFVVLTRPSRKKGGMTLVTKLCLVTHWWTETPFRMEGVSAGAEPASAASPMMLSRRSTKTYPFFAVHNLFLFLFISAAGRRAQRVGACFSIFHA